MGVVRSNRPNGVVPERLRNQLARFEVQDRSAIKKARVFACAVEWHDMHADTGLSIGPFRRPS